MELIFIGDLLCAIWAFTYMIILALHRVVFLSSALSAGSESLSNLPKVPQPGSSAHGLRSGLSDCKAHFSFTYPNILDRGASWDHAKCSDCFQWEITYSARSCETQPILCLWEEYWGKLKNISQSLSLPVINYDKSSTRNMKWLI